MLLDGCRDEYFFLAVGLGCKVAGLRGIVYLDFHDVAEIAVGAFEFSAVGTV